MGLWRGWLLRALNTERSSDDFEGPLFCVVWEHLWDQLEMLTCPSFDLWSFRADSCETVE